MRFDILTLFPDLFSSFLKESILGRSIDRGIVDIRSTDIRSFAQGPHRSTDDRPYGGGSGMVMRPGPIFRALESIERAERSLVILLTPQGKTFVQTLAWELSRQDQLVLVCGRYEGVDERIRSECGVDLELSIGDYILSGGEMGAMVVIDAVTRLLPGVLGGERSNLEDSFEDGLLEYPQYTRPRVFKGKAVPPVLLSGDHEKIRLWRRTESLKRTLERRPDLLEKTTLKEEDRLVLTGLRKQQPMTDRS